MENMTTKITSSYNNALDIKVVDGHFATNHSHINKYIDMTTLKSRRKMALAAAKSMATEYVATTIVDTIVCMDGTEVIGAYLANALTENGIVSMNQHQTIYIMTPEVHSSGQLIFRDNLQPMIKDKNILLLLASATTGKTIKQSIECIEYYGGSICILEHKSFHIRNSLSAVFIRIQGYIEGLISCCQTFTNIGKFLCHCNRC